MTHFLLPFMVFTILASLVTQNPDLRRAAEIMGAGRVSIFASVTLPLACQACSRACFCASSSRWGCS